MVVGGKVQISSGGVCSACSSAQRNWDTWMRHLSEYHPVPEEWLSEKALRLCGEAAQRPYTSITESKKKRKKDYIPRPLNSFMIFARHMRRSILDVFSEASNSDISKQLGEVWRTLAPSVKSQYNNEASKLAKIHLREFPNYKYQPKKKVKPSTPGGCNNTQQHTVQTIQTTSHHHSNHHVNSHHINSHHVNNHHISHHQHQIQQIRYQPTTTTHHTVTKLSNGGMVSMIPLSIKTEGITVKRWTPYQFISPANATPMVETVESPIAPTPMMTSFPMITSATSIAQQSDSDVAVGDAGAESYTPLAMESSGGGNLLQRGESASFSNYDYFAHLMDCSGLSGLNLETITFGDLPYNPLDDDDDNSEGSINVKSEDLYQTTEDDFKMVTTSSSSSGKLDCGDYHSVQTPSSDMSDEILNILPSSVLSSDQESGFGSLDLPFGGNGLPHLQSWAGLKL